MDLTYNFGLGADNGNVLGITNNITAGRSLTAAYDALNRLESAYTSTWSEQYGIDLWGNLTTISAMSGKPAGETLSQSATTQNRFAGFSYDAAGNLLNDGTTAYTFDAENRIRTAGTTTYYYDGDGKRVAKSSGGSVYKIYWYGMNSDSLNETDGAGSTANTSFSEYVFFNGKRIAANNAFNQLVYIFTDHLGTARVWVPSVWTSPCYDSDFYPFGRQSTVYTNICPPNYKFTGKERDETSLDDFGARNYSSQYGRFMIPDWAAKATAVPYADFGDPRSLNLYSYVRNNPLSHADLDGHCSDDSRPCQQEQQETQQRDAVEQVAHDTVVGSAKEIANEIIGLSNAINSVVDSALAAGGSSFSFGQTAESQASTPGERGAMLATSVGLLLVGGAEEKGFVSSVNVAKSLASDAQVAAKGEAIAGAGSSATLRDAARLAGTYGGTPGEWSKMTSTSFRAAGDPRSLGFETHWYQNVVTGMRVEYKTVINWMKEGFHP